jgi:hypothetical protein
MCPYFEVRRDKPSREAPAADFAVRAATEHADAVLIDQMTSDAASIS